MAGEGNVDAGVGLIVCRIGGGIFGKHGAVGVEVSGAAAAAAGGLDRLDGHSAVGIDADDLAGTHTAQEQQGGKQHDGCKLEEGLNRSDHWRPQHD